MLMTDVEIGSATATVTAFAGTVLGEPILGLFLPDGWWRNDNLIYSLTDEILNEGISGYTASWYFNLYLSDTPGAGDSILFCNTSNSALNTQAPAGTACNATNEWGQNFYYGNFARGEFLVRSTPGEIGPVVPLPAALPLLASALGALGVIGWRKRRQKSFAG